MKSKFILTAFLFVLMSQIGSAQSGLNNILAGKWDWVSCSGGIHGQGCSMPGPLYSTYFYRLPGDSLLIKVMNGNTLISSGTTIANFGSTIYGTNMWRIPIQTVDLVHGIPIIPVIINPNGLYAVIINNTNDVGFADNAFDGFTYYYEKDLLYKKACSFNLSLSSVADSCSSGNGSATANVSGDFPPFSYEWNTNPPQNTSTINNLSSGTYTVTVSDYYGCELIDTVTISNFSIYDTVTIVTYDTVKTTVTDTNHVIVYDTIPVFESISVTDTLFINVNTTGLPPNNQNLIKVYPNPTSDFILIDNGDYMLISSYSVEITNELGQTMFQSNINQQLFTIDLSTLGGAGTYFLGIYDGNDNMVEQKKIILR